MYHEALEDIGFQDRICMLRKVKRFGKSPVVFYRSDLEMHTTRIRWMIEECEEMIKERLPEIKIGKVKVMSLIHDDPETMSKRGDVELSDKMKMSQNELAELEEEENQAVRKLVGIWPTNVYGYNYEELLLEAKGKNTPESQLASYFDKLESPCEALHEVLAGNRSFYEGKNGNKRPIKGSSVIELVDKYKLISPFFQAKHPIIPPFNVPDAEILLTNGKLHTHESIYQPTGIAHYDFWKSVILKNGGSRGLEWLTKQVEF